MEAVATVLILLVAVVIGSAVSRVLPFNFPTPLVQVALGAIAPHDAIILHQVGALHDGRVDHAPHPLAIGRMHQGIELGIGDATAGRRLHPEEPEHLVRPPRLAVARRELEVPAAHAGHSLRLGEPLA